MLLSQWLTDMRMRLWDNCEGDLTMIGQQKEIVR